MNFDGVSENAHVASSLVELRDEASFGEQAGSRQDWILRDHPPGAEDPIPFGIAHLEVLAIVLHFINGGKVVAYLPQVLSRIFVTENDLDIFSALLEFVVLGLIDAAAEHPQAGQAEERGGRGEHGEVPECEANTDGQRRDHESLPGTAAASWKM